MTVKELIAEVTSTLKQYEESGLIDHRSLKLWIKSALKSFGSPIMTLTEKTIDIINGCSDLPDEFWSLELAVKCNVTGYSMECGEESHLMRSSTYKERIEQVYVWDNMSNQHIGTDYKQITTREYIDSKTIANFTYGNLIPLTLVRGISKEYIGGNCKNRLFYKSPYEINILNGNKLQTNFNKGFVYMQYNALPTDEEGNIYIPDSDKLVEYLQYYLQRRILESIWLNNDDADLMNKLSYLTQKEREYKALATTQLKFEALGKNWAKKLKAKMIQETNCYERLFPIT